MEVPLLNKDGQEIGKISLRDEVFCVKARAGVVHQVEIAYLAGLRRGTSKTKTKGEVSGGGKKPWKQKGTGRARQGSSRSIQWRGGGVSFGPSPRSYKQGTPKQIKRLALLHALTEKANAQKIFILDQLALEQRKTKTMVQMINKFPFGPKTLLLLPAYNKNIMQSCANIKLLEVALVSQFSLHSLLNCDKVVFLKEALEKFQELVCQN